MASAAQMAELRSMMGDPLWSGSPGGPVMRRVRTSVARQCRRVGDHRWVRAGIRGSSSTPGAGCGRAACRARYPVSPACAATGCPAPDIGRVREPKEQISTPRVCLRSTAKLLLDRLSVAKCSGLELRIGSPVVGSTLMTSAPNSARIAPVAGPAMYRVSSTTRQLESGRNGPVLDASGNALMGGRTCWASEPRAELNDQGTRIRYRPELVLDSDVALDAATPVLDELAAHPSAAKVTESDEHPFAIAVGDLANPGVGACPPGPRSSRTTGRGTCRWRTDLGRGHPRSAWSRFSAAHVGELHLEPPPRRERHGADDHLGDLHTFNHVFEEDVIPVVLVRTRSGGMLGPGTPRLPGRGLSSGRTWRGRRLASGARRSNVQRTRGSGRRRPRAGSQMSSPRCTGRRSPIACFASRRCPRRARWRAPRRPVGRRGRTPTPRPCCC